MKTVRTYVIGYVLSLVLTSGAFWLVSSFIHAPQATSPALLARLLVVLALTQLFVQVALFLHVGQEQKPRWNVVAFALTLFMVIAVVGGTLWIMKNLDYLHAHGGVETHDMFVEENIFPHTP